MGGIAQTNENEIPPDASIHGFTTGGGQLPFGFSPLDFVTTNDLRVRSTTNTTQSEMSIAVHPLNDQTVLASANASDYPVTTIYGTGAYWSTNGGTTWQGFDQPPSGNNRGDPAAAIDRNGYFYVGSIAPNLGQGIMRSTNSGSTWTYTQIANPAVPGDPNYVLDKNHLAIDNRASGTYSGNLYSAWSDFAFADRRITVARSTNQGAAWVNQQVISGNFAGSGLAHQGVNLQVGPSGTVYACWAVRDASSPFTERGIGFNKSTNGGQTWGTAGYAINNIKGMRQNPYPVLGFRTNSFPVMGVNMQSGRAYIVWVNIGVPGINTGDPDVYLIYSDNAGASWTSPQRVNDDQSGNGALQFHCWLTVDGGTGNVFTAFYDNRANINTSSCEFYVSKSTDGGSTFVNYGVSDDAFSTGPLPGFSGNYNGEYPGIAALNNRVYPIWHTQVPSANSQGWLSHPEVEVALDQRNGGGPLSGTPVGRWEGGPNFHDYTIPIANPFNLLVGNLEVLKGYQELVGTPAEKYHRWNDETDVRNHHKFTIRDQPAELVSWFNPTRDAGIRAQLIEDGTYGASLNLYDPWFVDFNEPPYGLRNSGMPPQPHPVAYDPNNEYNIGVNTAFKGVFLNQDPAQTPTYYSVGAPSPNTINGWESYFVNWTGTSVQYQNANAAQTGVVFQQSGATATAKYKAHLGSSFADATGSNSQRKMVDEAALGGSYLLYPSAGEVWIAQSYGASSEVRVSDNTGGFGAPSLASTGGLALAREVDGPAVYVTYRKTVGSNYLVYLREKRGLAWQNPIQINTVSIPTSVDTRPVIGRTNTQWQIGGPWDRPQLLAVWESSAGLRHRTANGETNGSWSWDPLGDQQLAATGNKNPSVSSAYVDYGSNRPYLYITYDNNNDIFMKPYGGNWAEPVQTIPASITPVSYASQVAAKSQGTYPTQHEVHVVWEKYQGAFTDGGGTWDEIESSPPPMYSVMYQGRTGSSWGTAREWVSTAYDYKRPSVVNLSNGNVVVTWDNGFNVYRSTRQSGVWSTEVVAGPGVHANLVQHGTTGLLSEARYTAMGISGPPFAVQVSGPYTSPGGGLAEQYSRRIVAARVRSLEIPLDTAAHCEVELSGVSLKLSDGTVVPLSFIEVDDALPGFTEHNAWSYLATEAVILPSTIDSIAIEGTANVFTPTGLFGTGDRDLRLTLDLIDARDSSVIRRLGAERVFARDTLSQLRIRERLNALAGREVIIRPTLAGIAKGTKNIVHTLVHVHTLIEDSSAEAPLPLVGSPASTPIDLPSQFALHQNYPNPFNPSTEIKFDLPEAGSVSLTIYDVLGRKVANLADGYREAGYHAMTWDASGSSSGVYFARFAVTDAAGKVAYTGMNKLLLMK